VTAKHTQLEQSFVESVASMLFVGPVVDPEKQVDGGVAITTAKLEYES
jgi:hypothetical protein